MTRFLALSVLLLVGVTVIAVALRRAATPVDVRLTWTATAQQFGPVSYRDPVGAISPDGHWIAFSEGRFLRVRPVDGGPSIDFVGDAQIRTLAWAPDSRAILANGYRGPATWAVFD